MTERRIGWRDWTLVLVTLAIWVAMLAVCVMDVQRAESQVTIPGAAKGQVKVPIHAHTDIGNGGKIKARDLDWSSVESGFPLGGCSIPCLDDANNWTAINRFETSVIMETDVIVGTDLSVAGTGALNHGLMGYLHTLFGAYFQDSVSIAPATDVLPLRVTQHSGATADLTDWNASTGDRLAKIDPMGAGHFGDNSGVGTPLILYNGYADDASSSDVTFNVFGLTADRTITIPDGTGNMVITGVVSDFSGGTGSTLRSSTASSGAAFQDNTTSSKKLRVITSGSSVSTNNAISFTTASSRTFAFTDQVTPTVVLKTGTDGNHVNQTADIGSTTLVTPPAAGLYRVSYYLRTTTADITSIESVTLSVTYTDNVGSTTRTDPSPIALLSTNSLDAGSFVVYVASGSITYTAADGGGGYGSAAYELRIRAEAL